MKHSHNIKRKNNDIIYERIFTFMLVLVFAIICFVVFPSSIKGENQSRTYQYTIESGDTLWDIACENYPSGVDVRQVIYDIKKINHIEDSGTIAPGNILYMPIYN